MDTPTNTFCAGANWKLVSLSSEVFKDSPFLESYKPVKEISLVRVSTVWMDPNTSREYLIVGDQFICFVTIMNHPLINPNQVRIFNILVQYNPFDVTFFGIDADKDFIPFTYKGSFISF